MTKLNDETKDTSMLEGKTNPISETPYRYVIVTIYCLLYFACGMQWITFSAIADKFKIEYQLNQFEVDLFSIIFMAMYPITSIPSSYILDIVNIRMGVYTYLLS
jgi:fucose permease